VETGSRKVCILWGVGLTLLLVSGCVPRVTPVAYYSRMRSSITLIKETQTGRSSVLECTSVSEGQGKVSASTSALQRWARENPERARQARDYSEGLAHGLRVGKEGSRLEEALLEGKSKAWLEGASWGNRMGICEHDCREAYLAKDNDRLLRAQREFENALGEKIKQEAMRQMREKLKQTLELELKE